MSALRQAVDGAERALAAAGVPSPRHDAEELAAHSLGVERRELWRFADVGAGFTDGVARRAAREPLQHITGRAAFRHLEVRVGPGVFVPRPETEVVAGAAVGAARAAGPEAVVVDLGTGSGAIALAVAQEVPEARVHAVESEPAALAWAGRNLAGSGVRLHASDMATAAPELDGAVDVVVANPPYVPDDGEVRDPEVASYDPAAALWAGQDGLDAIRVVELVAARLLRAGGVVVVEHADRQGVDAPDVFRATGRWVDVVDHRDLTDRPRYLTASRAEPTP
ncbi:MAG TPA: peptide chain release factor N(5)-glutamine methyltransferase [Pseudonocardia sp.]|nr:peptide chain release factor N(5)-glutamine methyltransferase [Pseudonocardia sp.]